MAYLNDRIRDNGLSALTSEGNKLVICSSSLSLSDASPPTYTEANSTYALGNKTSITIGSPADGASNGRRVTVSAITGGSVTATGTATCWAIVDTSNSRVLAANTLSSSQSVTNGNTFSLSSFDITLPDAA